ncbi:MAG: hypothetical protein ACXW36_03860 [Nitrospira sp.]
MPNTLGHLGIQAIITRTLIKEADLKWIALGAIIPDIPWITQRLVLSAPITILAYDVRLYAIVQSSLVFSLILSAALAVVANQPTRTFAILSLGSAMHLILDAFETKWGNGVHFFAPLSWDLSNFGLFWPEDLITYLLSLSGLFYIGYAWKRLPVIPLLIAWPPLRHCLLSGVMFAVYLLLPLPLMSGPEAADNHSVKTLREVSERAGRGVKIDRPFYRKQPDENRLRIFTGEEFKVQGLEPPSSGTLSVKGRFVNRNTIEIVDYHAHPPGLRDAASYIGLALVIAVWSRALVRGARLKIPRRQSA